MSTEIPIETSPYLLEIKTVQSSAFRILIRGIKGDFNRCKY